jgi:hypothetical protein
MNNPSDTRSSQEQDQVESVRPDAQPAPDVMLVDLGKVSDTKGGFVGHKPDTGFGVSTY